MKKQKAAPTLRDKQVAFVEHYLQCWNATEAARRAGYSDKTACAMGWENLRKPEIRQAIDARLAEHHLSADEVLARLASHAQASMGDFVDPETWELDLQSAADAGKLHLIKKLKHTRTTKGDGNDAYTTDVREIELHDAQSALALIGRRWKLFAERQEITGANGGPIQHEHRDMEAVRTKRWASAAAAITDAVES